MLTGLYLLLFILAILLFIILACAILRWHPFLVLLVAAITTGLGTGFTPEQTLGTILQGTSTVFANIGFIIALGTILGEVLEKTGAVQAIANAVFKRLGSTRVLPGISLIGLFTGIPVFCDSGFVILSSLARSLAVRSSVSYSAICIALATGLYASHVLIPPTPGPLAAAGALGLSADIGWVMLLGLVVSVPAVIVGWWFARRLAAQEPVAKKETTTEAVSTQRQQKVLSSVIPLLLPVSLIAMGSLVPFLSLSGRLRDIVLFMCHPTIALLTGVLTALAVLGSSQRKEWNKWIQHALLQAGPIILITAAGGALGAVLKATPLADEFKTILAGQSMTMLLFLPIAYLLAAGLKTAQGSSTASLIITSSIMAPLINGIPIHHVAEKALLVMSIGAGAMSVSHANDSYFWVVAQYSQLPVDKMYRHFTLATFFMGLSVLVSCLLLSLVFQ
jgi:GntP family gluconate:H+ symporter